ncbi:MAG: alpha/beta hydrolase [Rhodospirillales bacterium]|nr:alpha/beta hydrolase [Rhodospirillales bacterium]MBT4039636.1 alpha/beta hydrolase [Rhodospirillales bacterium]MBT5352542.1 alpha/beta hydrolase [Rhodospirillales bacterium]MBT5519522.1 alpha/beta hydrolase [Rhodospirillales bacterium]MBT7779110.1 alpha/beta hydrolase [Rhodospirillales bacterium]
MSAWRNGSLPWNEALSKPASDLLEALSSTDMDIFEREVAEEARRRCVEFTDGVQQYWNYKRATHSTGDLDCMWSDGSTRLLDYGGDGIPLLVIPSLINRYHVLDLSCGHNFLGALIAGGYRPFVVDWGAPDKTEQAFNLSSYVVQRLEPALDQVSQITGFSAVGVVGYCMGGMLATALTTRKPDQVAALVLLATPWNFHKGDATRLTALKASLPQISAAVDALGQLPVDVLQTMFSGLSPWLTIDKFRRFSHMNMNSTKARSFVELEDWLNDGVPLVHGVAKECLNGWYGDNTPYNGAWKVGGAIVDPTTITQPVLVAIPQTDHIVPPESARALAQAIPQAHAIEVQAGHIGMVAGGQAKKGLMRPMIEWLVENLPQYPNITKS